MSSGADALIFTIAFGGDATRGNGAGIAERTPEYAIFYILFIQYLSSRK